MASGLNQFLISISFLCMFLFSRNVFCFPPYFLTDADTADPWTLEARLGLLKLGHKGDETAYSSPLVRFNFGFPHKLELLSEFEFRADQGRVGEAAIGFKWIPLVRALQVGLETLMLLPVSRSGGLGVETSLLTTVQLLPVVLHVNAGGFYDARPAVSESGWKGGMITEVRLGPFRPGAELFLKQKQSEPLQVFIGPGIIVDVGPFDLRTGLHLGLTSASPDLIASFWMTAKFPLYQRQNGHLE